MDIRNLYRETEKKLNRIDFESIWHGFHKYDFAYYDEKKVYLPNGETDRDNRFLGNTAIDFNGERLAIWKIDEEKEPINADDMAANLVHEMFHCYQAEKGETRYPDDLRLLAYPDSIENYAMKFYENRLLEASLDSKENFEKFLSVRQKRSECVGDMARQEFCAETVEGLAEYCGIKALKQLSPTKYTKRLNCYREKLKNLSQEQFNIRRISYFSGVLFVISAFKHGFRFDSDLAAEKTLFEQITVKPQTVDCGAIPKKEVEQVFKAYAENKSKTIADFMSEGREEETFDGYICGYDPMNMLRVGDKLFCAHFIMLNDGKSDKPTFINGPLLLILKSGSDRQVEKIIK